MSTTGRADRPAPEAEEQKPARRQEEGEPGKPHPERRDSGERDPEERNPGEQDSEDRESDGPHPYFLALEEMMIDLRGSPLLLPPADWQVARGWFEAGIPLELVSDVLTDLCRRRQEQGKDPPASLRYCRRPVEAEWRRRQELTGLAGVEAVSIDVPARLETLSAALDAALEASPLAALGAPESWGRRLRELEGSAEGVEGELAKLDRELLETARAALDDEAREEVERELESARRALGDRLPEGELERAEERLREQLIRRRLELPLLSLFSPQAVPPETAPSEAARPDSGKKI